MEIVTDLSRIQHLGDVNSDENWAFRSFLKRLDISQTELDSIVHQINDDVSAQIDCTTCGNCCNHISPVLAPSDIVVFASGLDFSEADLKANFLKPSADNPTDFEFNALPCPFLKDNRCSNYVHRPNDCRSYPHLHKDNFRSRLMNVIGNYSLCPIVFNVYERLKMELWDEEDDVDDEWY